MTTINHEEPAKVKIINVRAFSEDGEEVRGMYNEEDGVIEFPDIKEPEIEISITF
jgi:hypothetical protein